MKTFRLLATALSMLVIIAMFAGSAGAHEREFDPDAPEALPPLALAKTGQTTSYYPGDDGDLQIGIAWPSPRFVDQGDGTMKDMLTGLSWLKDANCFGNKTWAEALTTVAAFNQDLQNPRTYPCQQYTGTHTDWRLPNINELRSLINTEQQELSTWLGTQGFVHTIPKDPMGWELCRYWSSTSSDWVWASAPIAWGFEARLGLSSLDEKQIRWHVWPVRGESTTMVARTGQTTSMAAGDDGELRKGVIWPSPRFTVSGDTVTDDVVERCQLPGHKVPEPWVVMDPWRGRLAGSTRFCEGRQRRDVSGLPGRLDRLAPAERERTRESHRCLSYPSSFTQWTSLH